VVDAGLVGWCIDLNQVEASSDGYGMACDYSCRNGELASMREPSGDMAGLQMLMLVQA
jgi:hypothetical protein